MATVEVKKCDVYGTTKDVDSYTVSIFSGPSFNDSPVDSFGIVDLCPRGLRRLKRFIDRGTTPQTKKTTADVEEPDDGENIGGHSV